MKCSNIEVNREDFFHYVPKPKTYNIPSQPVQKGYKGTRRRAKGKENAPSQNLQKEEVYVF